MSLANNDIFIKEFNKNFEEDEEFCKSWLESHIDLQSCYKEIAQELLLKYFK